MTRLQQARHLALTDPYWAGYVAGLVDKHHVRNPQPPAHDTDWDGAWTPASLAAPEPTSDELLTNMARVIASTGHPTPKETP